MGEFQRGSCEPYHNNVYTKLEKKKSCARGARTHIHWDTHTHTHVVAVNAIYVHCYLKKGEYQTIHWRSHRRRRQHCGILLVAVDVVAFVGRRD
jgi:hypothetical protein